jgi:hypothetical protein
MSAHVSYIHHVHLTLPPFWITCKLLLLVGIKSMPAIAENDASFLGKKDLLHILSLQQGFSTMEELGGGFTLFFINYTTETYINNGEEIQKLGYIIQFFIVSVLHQQLEGQLQMQHKGRQNKYNKIIIIRL